MDLVIRKRSIIYPTPIANYNFRFITILVDDKYVPDFVLNKITIDNKSARKNLGYFRNYGQFYVNRHVSEATVLLLKHILQQMMLQHIKVIHF